MAFSLGEYQDIFLEEADEQIQELNQNLLELEKNPDDFDIINNIFRAAHSLKSSAAFVGLNELSDLAHKMENLLQGIRDKTLDITPEVVDVIFKCFDEINSVIDTVASGEEPTQDLAWIINEIQEISERSKAGGKDVKTETTSSNNTIHGGQSNGIPKTTLTSEEVKLIRDSISNGLRCYELIIYIEETAQMKWVKAQLVLNNLSKIGDVLKTIPPMEDLGDDDSNNVFKVILLSDALVTDMSKACELDLIFKVELKSVSLVQKDGKYLLKFGEPEIIFTDDGTVNLVTSKETEAVDVVDAPVSVDEDIDTEEISFDEDDDEEEDEIDDDKIEDRTDQERRKAPVLKTVKVSVDKLDMLLNNVGELVIANSGYYKLYEEIRKTSKDKSIINEMKNRMEQMARIAKDLQTGIMKTRMVPIGQVFNRFNRLVRDLAKEFNKNIELIIKGEDTELDKKVIDAIGEPLMHLIRNAIDHGIETSDDRKKIGKPDVAHITLNAYQGGNQIFVEVSDDGRGLNIDEIKETVVKRDLATVDMLSAMDTSDIFNFIFMPGFSTAEKISDISGRGVGMNVVKEIVNELNGNVTIETEQGMGTRFVMTFPLTLAIIPAIMTRVRAEIYAIPLSDVIETIKISESDITTIEGYEVINLRGEILSLLRLNRFVQLDTALKPNQKIPVVVVGFGNRKIGLMVDFLEGKQEIVIKSLEQNYTTVEGLAGASLLGDGSICLILDISSMINKVIAEQDKLKRLDLERLASGEEAIIEELAVEEKETTRIQEKTEDVVEDKVEPAEEPLPTEEPVTLDAQPEEEPVISEPETKGDSVMKTEEPVYETAEKITEPVSDVKEESPAMGDAISHESIPDSEDKPYTREPAVSEPVSEESTPEPPADAAEMDTSHMAEEPVADKEEYTAPSQSEGFVKEDIKKEADAEAESVDEDDEIRDKVHDALQDFRKELKQSVQSTMDEGGPDEHMASSLDISSEHIKEFQVVANVGAANAAESLSKILGKRIDLSIPEVVIKPIEQIPRFLGDVDSIYIGVMLPVLGDVKGTELFILEEGKGLQMIDLLYGTSSYETKEINEDGESALKELTNIVGSSVINVFAEKTSLVIKPGVPVIVHDYMQSVIDSILVMYNLSNDYAVIMDTAFYFEDDQIIGNLLLLPEADSFKNMIDSMRMNVESS